MYGPCFVMLASSAITLLVALNVFMLNSQCKCSVALPHGTMCDCGIS